MLRSFVWVAAALSFAPACKTECHPYGSVEGPWVSVSVGGNQSCGIKEDGTLLCWGGQYEDELCPPEEQFAQVSVGAESACENPFSCGIAASDGTGICWGNNQYGQLAIPQGLAHFDLGAAHGCGIEAGGALSIECWGLGSWGVNQAPKDGGYAQISVGAAHSCARKDSGEIICWGGDGGIYTEMHLDEVPTGTYKRVAAGAYATCGIDSFDELVCWGNPADGVTTNPPDGAYVEVAVGGHLEDPQTQHACGIKTSGKMVCWGNDDDFQSTVNPDWN
jgi:alpha-tubulin suppressor-like RCC1 family protein